MIHLKQTYFLAIFCFENEIGEWGFCVLFFFISSIWRGYVYKLYSSFTDILCNKYIDLPVSEEREFVFFNGRSERITHLSGVLLKSKTNQKQDESSHLNF